MNSKVFIICIVIIAILVLIVGTTTHFMKGDKIIDENVNENINEDTNENDAEDAIIEIAVFPSGTLNETYYFTLSTNSTLESYLGDRKNDDIKETPFLISTTAEKEKQLNEQEMQLVMNLVEQIESSDYTSKYSIENWFDVWYVAMIYNGKVYEACHSTREFKLLSKLLDQIIELSPLEVDLREFI